MNQSSDEAIHWFRDASPYINAHRNKTLVLCLPGDVLQGELLPTLTHDLTLLSHLGLRLVVCFGLRAQMNDALAHQQHDTVIVEGRRVTDSHALNAIISAAGVARVDIESRLSMGLPNTPMRGAQLSVSSGNFITAQPFGVHDGVDFQNTGAIRQVNHRAMQSLLEAGHLVLVPPLGYSLTGEVFNLRVDEVAVATASALEADKIVFFVDQLPVDRLGKLVRQASARKADTLQGLQGDDEPLAETLSQAVRASRQGVTRAHLLRKSDPDALLSELFSLDGSGTMITAQRWETVRDATIDDVGGIIELIAPLQANGTLVGRSREQLELDIEHFVVSERDGTIVACASLHLHILEDSKIAEIACVATHSEYRGEGRADQLMELLESRAHDLGCQALMLLSTRTGHWFIERGYSEAGPDALPESRQADYNWQRGSKVYIKPLV